MSKVFGSSHGTSKHAPKDRIGRSLFYSLFYSLFHRLSHRLVRQVPALTLALAGSLAAHAAQAEPEISWYVSDSPPQYIIEGPHKGEGFNDLTLQRQLIPALTGYRHNILIVPMGRREQMFKSVPASCALGILKNPEREQYMTFSAPFRIGLSPGVFARRADSARLAAYLDGDGKLSLAKLLADGKMTVGMDYARSYGQAFDAIVNQYKGQNNLVKVSTRNSMHSLVLMAAMGRLDVVPAYPFEAMHYLNPENPESRNKLQFYPLADQPDYTLSHVVCSKTAYGERVIEKIDAILKRPGVREAIARYYESWLDEDSRKTARRAFEEAFVVTNRKSVRP